MKRLHTLLLTLMLLVCAILRVDAAEGGDARAITVNEITRVTHLSSSGANVYVDVQNNSRRTIVIKQGEVDIMVDGNLKSTISLREKVVIPKGYAGEVLLPLRFRSTSTLTLQSILRRIAEGDSEGITITYRLRGSTRLIRRSLRGDDIAISEFFDMFAVPKSAILRAEELFR